MKNTKLLTPRIGRILHFDTDTIHVLESGPKGAPEVVVLHGCGSLAEEVILPFEQRSAFRLIAPDRPGYGYSSSLLGARGPLAQSFWLERLLEFLGGTPRVIAAHSIGCAAALLLAARKPELIRGLLLIAPCCRPVHFKPLLLLRTAMAPLVGAAFRRHLTSRWSAALLRRGLLSSSSPNPIPTALASLPAQHIVSLSAIETMAAELTAFNGDMAKLGSIVAEVPISVVFGNRDRVIDHRWHGDMIRKKHGSPVIRVIDDVGHMPHHVEPDICIKELDAIIDATTGLGKPHDHRAGSIGLRASTNALALDGARASASEVLAQMER